MTQTEVISLSWLQRVESNQTFKWCACQSAVSDKTENTTTSDLEVLCRALLRELDNGN